MTKCGPAIQLCKAGASVCKWVILTCETMQGLCPAVDELEKGVFVRV